ncbi:MAG: hypothetical protein VB092_02950 [Oscillospiraceae bacterium]|nr:hypothetical protein [Oscillospiraceae bacterium]
MPKEFAFIISPFLQEKLSEDEFQECVLAYCAEMHTNGKASRRDRVRERIRKSTAERRREENAIYNPYRNISLNQCFGESKVPISEWMNLTDWKEWE